MYRLKFKTWLFSFVFIGLLSACGETAGDSTETSLPEPSEPGKADTLKKDDLLGLRSRDGVCDQDVKFQDPDCFIRIASWNIKDFSRSKVNDEEIMEQIAHVLKHFDVIGIQEVSNIQEKRDKGCKRNAECPDHPHCGVIRESLDDYLNTENTEREFEFAFSPQVRDERYLFVYNKDQVDLIASHLMKDPGEEDGAVCSMEKQQTGNLKRQPHLGVFKSGEFSFGLLKAHVAPREAAEELSVMPQYIERARQMGVSDVILAGDLNADCNYLSAEERRELELYEDYLWLFPQIDTTLSEAKCNYDQIIIGEDSYENITGQLAVFEDISPDMTNHYLISANFFVGEDSDEHHLEPKLK